MQRPSTLPPNGSLPLEVQLQSPLAQHAFRLLAAKPGRSLSSIARELGTDPGMISRAAKAGNWIVNVQRLLDSSQEAVQFAAAEEARRSRVTELAANRLFEKTIHSTLANLVEVNDQGEVVLREGCDVADVEKLARARQTHVKTTMLLTGEAAATMVAVGAASATRIVLDTSGLAPVPMPVKATVVGTSEALEDQAPGPTE